jgi:hypothetical protein
MIVGRKITFDPMHLAEKLLLILYPGPFIGAHGIIRSLRKPFEFDQPLPP